MRLMIIGAGSLGLLFAAKLSALCEYMKVVTRTREQAERLRAEGIRLAGTGVPHRTTRGGIIEFESYTEETSASDLVQSYDYILLMVKQPAITPELAAYIRSKLSSGTRLISFQNGVGHESILGEALPAERLLLAVTTEGARREGDTSVAHTGHGVTYLGSLRADEEESTHFLLVNLLKEAGFQTFMSNNMEERIWSKLLINSVINPLTAILRVRNGQLLDSAWTMSLMRDLYREACLVVEARGTQVPDHLWDTILQVCEATRLNHSSMLQDIEQARSTEIDRINGSLLQLADELNLELPVHRTVYQLVKALE
ncbi:2-dehydropantoate 2-reductase [Bacillus sp. 3255]|uniref:ketopantoate reductase family protein n=1 Tax=Bacillus sp. 3255 TaxID=2817904 RepID=UPI0028578784|nr:2-dehydropantoate 2-reductase [Bacillus sp. 3255]MDR6880146.1 2-dehydropantoate 2-reductase [Bacillus sp. 3255]